jgi:hypothetical protein
MKFDKSYIFILSIVGIILLYSYYYFLKDNNNANKLWGSIKAPLLYIYYLSMLLSTIGFILLFFYLIYSDNFTRNNITQLFILILLIVSISILWTPLSITYLKEKNNLYKYLTLLVLFLVSLFSFLLLITLYNINDTKYIVSKNLALAGMLYFFIHAFFFDFITWSYHFFE